MDQQNLPTVAASTDAPALDRDAFKAGQAVGAERWPYSGAHPDCWLQPWRGVVLAQDDPQAWVDSMVKAKIYGRPTRAEIRTHIAHMEQLWAECPATCGRGPLFTRVIVLWDFGGGEQVVMREDPARVRPYRADVAAWRAAREARRAELEALDDARRAASEAARAA